jgi:protein O-GlcNAc transferase
MSNINKRIKDIIKDIEDNNYLNADIKCKLINEEEPNNSEGWLLRGVIERKAQKYDEAINSISKSILINEYDERAYNNLANVYRDIGVYSRSIENYLKSIEINKNYIDAKINLIGLYGFLGEFEEAYKVIKNIGNINHKETYNNIGNLLQRNGKYAESIELYLKALEIDCNYKDALINLSNAYRGNKNHHKAIKILDSIILKNSEEHLAYFTLANVYKDIEKIEKAEKNYKKAINIGGNIGEYYNAYGNLLIIKKEYENAREKYIKAIQLKSNYSEAYYNLALINIKNNEIKDAIINLNESIKINPKFRDGYINLVNIYMEGKNLIKAEELYLKCIEIDENYAPAYNNISNLYLQTGKIRNALEHSKKALHINSESFEFINNYGNILKEMGDLDGAEKEYKKAMLLNPLNPILRSNYIFCLNYNEKVDQVKRNNAAKEYGEIYKNLEVIEKNVYNNKRITIGFVSSDFRNHPVSFFLISVIKNIDKNKFKVISLSNNLYEDKITLELKKYFEEWFCIFNKSDDEASRLIKKCKIDVLIDLNGHTANNRLTLFARKPANLQITWLGYFGTTGMREIDFIIADKYVIPKEEQGNFVEKIWLMPDSYFCFTPPEINLPIRPLPALLNGYITFGCFNNLTKINDEVIKVWSSILNKVQNSKLLLKNIQFNDKEIRSIYIQKFSEQGVNENQIEFEGPSSREDYLLSYNKVDIALDPFPFPGGTTSIEGMWMGVPVITMKGNYFIAHNGETIAHNTNNSEWIVNDMSEYIKKAYEWSLNLDKLSKIREEMRSKIINSKLLNSKLFTLNFESGIIKMNKLANNK